MTMLTNASRYDWATWLTGILRSFIGGGAGAAAGAIGPGITDPDHFNFGTSGIHHILVSMAVSFAVVGLVHMFIFLQTHPGPDPVPPAKP